MRPLTPTSIKYASIIIGAFFCMLIAACNEEKSTPNWDQQGQEKAASNKNLSPSTRKPQNGSPRSQTDHKQAVRFLSYNLKNYLTLRRFANGQTTYTSKPESEIKALVDTIRSARPDILGVCEIGTEKDLGNFQQRLKEAGIELPHTYRTFGADDVRSLAILSRYPILSTHTPTRRNYQLGGKPFQISRGILDAIIQLPNQQVRFLGCHLKSKRPIKEADQELMRRNESMLLRQHIETIMEAKPDTRLIVYGDFNDTRRSKAIYTVKGRTNSDNHLKTIELKDSRGETWTHHWKREDVYSRFDYVMVHKNLAPYIQVNNCRILDPKYWEQASDHRALLVIIQ